MKLKDYLFIGVLLLAGVAFFLWQKEKRFNDNTREELEKVRFTYDSLLVVRGKENAAAIYVIDSLEQEIIETIQPQATRARVVYRDVKPTALTPTLLQTSLEEITKYPIK